MQNRELSWLKFNERVLEEAQCEALPLFERLKFISIFKTNLDEFFMVRVGSLVDCELVDPDTRENKTQMTPKEQIDAICKRVAKLMPRVDETYFALRDALEKEGVKECSFEALSPEQQKQVERYFYANVLPLLSPQVIDSRHPFPHLPNKTLNIAVFLDAKEGGRMGVIPVPDSLQRLVYLDGSRLTFLRVEELIYTFADRIFEKYKLREKTVLAVTRNADIDTDTGLVDEDVDYRQFMKKILKRRERLAPVRLELQYQVSDEFRKFLTERFKLKKEQVFLSRCPLTLDYIFGLEGSFSPEQKKKLLNPPFTPRQTPDVIQGESMIRQILKKDLLLSYPFESMSPFLNLIKEAAGDPMVLSIKITLYRVAKLSQLAEFLAEAAENGKEVTVLMELRARFDEQNNIDWAQRLEEAGCHVIYGFEGYKVHSKICLITRKEGNRLQLITQIGTGNYNEKTAKLYCDLSIMTADAEIGADARSFFYNMGIANLEGDYQKLLIGPKSLKPGIIKLMNGEIDKAQLGRPCGIIMKLNSLTDRDVIVKLIEASQAGVPIRLIVRGICCLTPGIPGYTENIKIISIVGRFLEHARVYAFGVGEEQRVFIGSADMMTRNTERRVEIIAPVESPEERKKVLWMVKVMLEDNVKARDMRPDGSYELRHPREGERRVESQQVFLELAARREAMVKTVVKKKGFFAKLFARRKR